MSLPEASMWRVVVTIVIYYILGFFQVLFYVL